MSKPKKIMELPYDIKIIIAETVSKLLSWNISMCLERIQLIVYESDGQ